MCSHLIITKRNLRRRNIRNSIRVKLLNVIVHHRAVHSPVQIHPVQLLRSAGLLYLLPQLIQLHQKLLPSTNKKVSTWACYSASCSAAANPAPRSRAWSSWSNFCPWKSSAGHAWYFSSFRSPCWWSSENQLKALTSSCSAISRYWFEVSCFPRGSRISSTKSLKSQINFGA